MNPEWRTGAIGLVLLEISDHSQVFPESSASALCYTEEKLHPEFRKEKAKRPATAKKTCSNALCQPAARASSPPITVLGLHVGQRFLDEEIPVVQHFYPTALHDSCSGSAILCLSLFTLWLLSLPN